MAMMKREICPLHVHSVCTAHSFFTFQITIPVLFCFHVFFLCAEALFEPPYLWAQRVPDHKLIFNTFLFFNSSVPVGILMSFNTPKITHVELMITSELPRSSESDKLLLLKMEFFALHPVMKVEDVVVEAEHNTSDLFEGQKSKVELLSMTTPTNGGTQMVSSLRVLSNTKYTVVMRHKEILGQDGSTRPLLTFSFKYVACLTWTLICCVLFSVCFACKERTLCKSKLFISYGLIGKTFPKGQCKYRQERFTSVGQKASRKANTYAHLLGLSCNRESWKESFIIIAPSGYKPRGSTDDYQLFLLFLFWYVSLWSL